MLHSTTCVRARRVCGIEAFRVLGIDQVDDYTDLLAQKLRDEIIRSLRVSHVRRTAARENWNETDTNHRIQSANQKAIPSPTSDPSETLPVPAFQDEQTIMLITKMCLAPKLTHLAR